MGFIDSVGWFPMRTKELTDDLGSGACLAILAQFPESASSWPFTFQGCHPVKLWRRPTGDEMERAKVFYGLN
jgi:hypothetical protein